ncbi:MAG TPA: hypothetical protein VNM14_20855 [Planctomycetota bacterium]|nr:hypothetical protein [Planctomycetota bacterium]
MADEVKRRGRGWKILGIVVGIILVCVGGLLLWVSAVSGRKLDQMDAKTKAMAAEWRARPAERPVLRGTAEPGNAWDDYNPALTAIRATKDISRLGMLVTRDPKGDPEWGRTTLATHAKTLEGLRQGAGRTTCRFPYDWEAGASVQTPSLLAAQSLGNLAVLHARALAEAGKPREAAGVLLDILQFGRDVGHDGVLICEMIGAAVLQLGLWEIRDLMKANLLDAAALRDLDAGLAVLDGSFPNHGHVLSNEAIFSCTELRTQAASANVFFRLLFADGFDRMVDMMEGAAKAETLPWQEVEAQRVVLERKARSGWNPLTKELMPGLGGTNKVTRHRLAQLRTLRMAIRGKLGGDALDLDDPFGAKLKSDGALKTWSVGPDGADDGGDGSWDLKGKDIVLDLGK